eukprot:TRINITY_DN12798_c0_g1_i1.p1 TRINITY_DN12798_c0_g1~~TRINITY_DN12798_c0_g1_i1.p1  ORF type:complete len:922 (+),score=221.87 TRINITY_DN12798_c0_g1_i1:94-2859(+)
MENDKECTQVFVWGSNSCGQLGLGNTQGKHRYCIPKLCTFNVKIRSVSCGEEHSAFVTDVGTLYTMGSNADGRLGIGDRAAKSASTPCLVEALSSFRVAEVACGMAHTVAVVDSGKAYSWGMGQYGALGINDTESQWFPVQVVFDERAKVKSASCGTRHTAMVTSEGDVFVCGANDAGQLGTGTRETQLRPVKVSALRDSVVQAACGILHTLLLTAEGEVLAMGGNHLGQLGTGDKRSSKLPVHVRKLEQDKVVKVAAGKFSAGVTEEGKLLVWGTGTFGEKLIPVALEGAWGQIKDVEVKGAFGAAIDFEGKLYSWGENACGELGVGDYKEKGQAVQVESLSDKYIFALSCGGAYVIALGSTDSMPSLRASEEYVASEPKRSIEKQMTSKNYEFDNREQREDMLREYDVERQKCSELERKISELQSFPFKYPSAQESERELKNKVILLEKQLADESKRCDDLLNQYRNNVRATDTFSISESKLQELEELGNELRVDNERMKNGGVSIGSNIRVSEVLKDYESRIEREIEDRQVIAQEKDEEIRALSEEVARSESVVVALKNEKSRMSESYNRHIWQLKETADSKMRALDIKTTEKEELIEQKQREEAQNRSIENDIAQTNSHISECNDSLQHSLSMLEDARHRVMSKENDIQDIKDKQRRILELIQNKEIEHNTQVNTFKSSESLSLQSIRELRSVLSEKAKLNGSLRDALKARVQELDTVKRDIESWLNAAEKSRGENRNLKTIIEELEGRSRRLMSSKELPEYASRFVRSESQYKSRFGVPQNYFNKMSGRQHTPEIGTRQKEAIEKRPLSQSRYHGRLAPNAKMDDMSRVELNSYEPLKDYSRLVMTDTKAYPTRSPDYSKQPKETSKELINSTKQFIQTLRISGMTPLSEKNKVKFELEWVGAYGKRCSFYSCSHL